VIAQIAAVLLPVFCLAAVGYGWRLGGGRFDLDFVTRLITNVGGPCLVFDSLSNLTAPLADFASVVLASIAMLVAIIAAGFLVLRVAKLSVRSYLPALAIGNTGNLGLPLSLFAFGEQGLGLAVAVFVTNSICQFTFVPLLQSRSSPWKTIVTTPMIYGAAAGLAVLLTGAQPPAWLATTIRMLGELTIPLMLLSLGHTLGGLRASNLKLAFGLGAARLALSFVAAVGIAELFGLSGVARGVFVLQGVMPVAVFTYLFAVRYERDADNVAGIVLVSTLLAALLLPLFVSYALWLSG
jgi:malate permease and related proteins